MALFIRSYGNRKQRLSVAQLSLKFSDVKAVMRLTITTHVIQVSITLSPIVTNTDLVTFLIIVNAEKSFIFVWNPDCLMNRKFRSTTFI